MDRMSKAHRSWLMGRVRSKDTKPELVVRSLLHRSGIRFSLKTDSDPGKPDLKLPKYNAVVFVHGCFWHRHPGCKNTSTPKSNISFWKEKFKRNEARDARNRSKLEALGWNVIVVWECEILKDPLKVLEKIVARLGIAKRKTKKKIEYPAVSGAEILKIAERKFRYGLKEALSPVRGDSKKN